MCGCVSLILGSIDVVIARGRFMGKIILVTASDSAYFALLRDWLDSIKSFPELADIELCILDVGLQDTQRNWLTASGVRIVQPDWDIEVTQTASWYKAMTARAYLPRHFPKYDIIGWLDADVWVQDPAYLRSYFIGAERYGFAITPEIDRGYEILFGEFNITRLFHYDVYYRCFGRMIADRLIQFPIINSGAFAIKREHPIWSEWQKACHHAMKAAPLKHSEQAALNFAIYNAPAYRPHMLPASANWICALACPMWDATIEKLVEPNLPHQTLGIIHLTGVRDAIPLPTTNGSRITTPLTFSGIRALRCDKGLINVP
jgi:hypothetical protein